MPPKVGESQDDLDSSGDFIFPNEDITTFDDEDEDTEDYDDMSGSGDEEVEEDSDATLEVDQYAACKQLNQIK